MDSIEPGRPGRKKGGRMSRETASIISEAIDALDDENLEPAVVDFLIEQKLIGEFLVWIEKWKHNHGL